MSPRAAIILSVEVVEDFRPIWLEVPFDEFLHNSRPNLLLRSDLANVICIELADVSTRIEAAHVTADYQANRRTT